MSKFNNTELQRVVVAAIVTVTAVFAWQYLTKKTATAELKALADVQIAEQVDVSTKGMIAYNDEQEAKKVEAEKAKVVAKAAQEAVESPVSVQVDNVAPVVEEPVTEAPVLDPNYQVDPTAIMDAAGISAVDRVAVNFIVSNESGWRPFVWNEIGAYGLCQALPASKMAVAGADWETNPVTQLRWCAMYAEGKGGWIAAANLWRGQGWW